MIKHSQSPIPYSNFSHFNCNFIYRDQLIISSVASKLTVINLCHTSLYDTQKQGYHTPAICHSFNLQTRYDSLCLTNETWHAIKWTGLTTVKTKLLMHCQQKLQQLASCRFPANCSSNTNTGIVRRETVLVLKIPEKYQTYNSKPVYPWATEPLLQCTTKRNKDIPCMCYCWLQKTHTIKQRWKVKGPGQNCKIP